MFYFCLSIFAAYQFGVIGAADSSGRAAVLISSATSVGFSVAAFVGGQLAEHFGYRSLPLFDATMMVAAADAALAHAQRLGSEYARLT